MKLVLLYPSNVSILSATYYANRNDALPTSSCKIGVKVICNIGEMVQQQAKVMVDISVPNPGGPWQLTYKVHNSASTFPPKQVDLFVSGT